MKELELGKYEVVGKHLDCSCGGKVMRITPNKILGNKYPKHVPDEWLWCEGSKWDRETREWILCKASSLNGDDLECV